MYELFLVGYNQSGNCLGVHAENIFNKSIFQNKWVRKHTSAFVANNVVLTEAVTCLRFSYKHGFYITNILKYVF